MFPVSLFRLVCSAVAATPLFVVRVFILLLPRIYVRFGAVIGLLVIDSVGLDLQLETVEIAMALIVALLRSCVSVCFAVPIFRHRGSSRPICLRLVATPRAIGPFSPLRCQKIF